MMIGVNDSAENIVGKGENAPDKHFFPFPTTFSNGYFFRAIKSDLCDKDSILYHTFSNFNDIEKLIVCCLTPFSAVFQLYRGGQRTYPCFPGVS